MITPLLVQEDPWLIEQSGAVQHRISRFQTEYDLLNSQFGSLYEYANTHLELGLHSANGQWVLKEWLPGAQFVSLVGDFNDWNDQSHPLTKNDQGIWSLSFEHAQFKHLSKFKLFVIGADGSRRHRIPSTVTRTIQDKTTHDFCAQVWAPPVAEIYQWKSTSPALENHKPFIYEAHVGIAGEDLRVHSYQEFTTHVLPRIHKLGYNTIQLMAVQEHPYYGSFGYHVSSFFGVSSRFGSPEDLKELIDTAHSLGIAVLLDLVHSHSIKNLAEGLNEIDGTTNLYFHEGATGEHPQWDSKCFNYAKPEVRRFFLSNIRYWLEEYQFDGFRFDGVTSMLYYHRGNKAFSDYWSYFNDEVDHDAVLYLQLANQLAREMKDFPLIIAEDMSGMPGLCRPIKDGGVGFTHRLGMGIPDYWIKLLKHSPDEEWNLQELWDTLNARRKGETTIAYAESHDQALVGDKTIAFWLMDQEMYWNMKTSSAHPVIDRGIALHKMIRLVTLAAGGGGYLNFIGNEFGHPEWLDFPREGNDWSYHYSRRLWSLADNEELRYQHLLAFDQSMIKEMKQAQIFNSEWATLYMIDEERKLIIFERNKLIFAFNFHVSESYSDLDIPVLQNGSYRILLSSDAFSCGGHNRVDTDVIISTYTSKNEYQRAKIYLPCRTAIVLQEVN